MQGKIIASFDTAREKILRGIDKLAEPVVQTLTPMGSNILYEDELGNVFYTNDGVTVAEKIDSEDEIEDTAIRLIKQAAKKTNQVAGDGTTTSILLARAFVKAGFKLLDSGWNPMQLKKAIEEGGKLVLEQIDALTKKVKSDKDLMFVAKVSANSDEEIAKNVVDAVKHAGTDGLIVLDDNSKNAVEVEKEDGFKIEAGMFSPLLSNQQGRFVALYRDVRVLITDKRIYHSNEVIALLQPLVEAGIRDVVIIARDFIGQAPNVFISNHVQGRMNILLVKDPDVTDKEYESLSDLADYLGCKVVSDKKGERTTELQLKDFGTARRVFADGKRTVILGNPNPQRTVRIKALREEIRTEKDNEKLKKRLARMTAGTVTIKIGGATPAEAKERHFRYEDSVNATRCAMREGYVVGGGLTLRNAWCGANNGGEIDMLFETVCKEPLVQIAKNCNLHYPTFEENTGREKGYNALTQKYENLEKAGIIEPASVVKNAFQNSLSAACAILSSRWIITFRNEKESKEQNEKVKIN